MTDLLKIIDELQGELMDTKGFFSKKVDLERCVELTEILKKEVPSTITEAHQILYNRKNILENADSVAKNTIREAEERASHIVDQSEIVALARLEEKKIVDMAYMQCDTLVERTKAHLDEMFKDIEQFLLSNLAMIRNNREELRGAMIMSGKK